MKRRFKDEHLAQAVELYDQGKSTRVIARIMGFAHGTVYNNLAKAIKMRPNALDMEGALSERELAIRQAYDAGASMAKVGKTFNISRQRVYQILRKTGRSRVK